MSRTILSFLALGLLASPLVGPATAIEKTITIKVTTDSPKKEAPFTGKRPQVDVAILLDTSNSMDGLIEQVR